MTNVRIYHVPGRGASVDDLIAEGLKPARLLVEERKLEGDWRNHMSLTDQSSVYFQWVPPHLEPRFRETCDWVSIEVDPAAQNVYNREFRAHNDPRSYHNSRMPLADLIARHEEAAELRTTLKPGEIILLHPITAIPTTTSVDDPRTKDYRWLYLNEILVPGVVDPSRFSEYHTRH
jgi:hypothetical protein